MAHPLSLSGKNLEVIAFLDIEDIFVKKNSVPKIRTFISAVIVTKEDVKPSLFFEKPTGIQLEAGDED